MRALIVAIIILFQVTIASAQRTTLEPSKSDSGTVTHYRTGDQYSHNQILQVGYGPIYSYRSFLVFDVGSITESDLIVGVSLRISIVCPYANDTIRLTLLDELSQPDWETVFSDIKNGDELGSYVTTQGTVATHVFELTTAAMKTELSNNDILILGLHMNENTSHANDIVNVKLMVDYLGGETAALTVDNVINVGQSYSGAENRMRINGGEFVTPPVQRSVYLGDNIDCEVWNARYDSSLSGSRMKPFLWELKKEHLPPVFVVENFDTSQTEFASYAASIIPFSISSENEYDNTFNVSVDFYDPWRISQADSSQTLIDEYVAHTTPYIAANDNATYGVFKNIFSENFNEIYSFKVPIAVDSLGTTLQADTIDYGDKVLANVRIAPTNSAVLSDGVKDGHYMKYDIVFTGDSSNVILEYKRHLNGSPTLSSPNQRNICCDYFGKYHLVYADQGEIYYTESGDGSRWIPEIRISSGLGEAANPSVVSPQGIYDELWKHNGTFVTFAEEGKIVFVVIDTTREFETIWRSDVQSANASLHPAVHSGIMCGKGLAVVVWEGSDGLLYTVTQNDMVDRLDHDILDTGKRVPGTSPGSMYPSLNHGGKLSWVNQDSVFIMPHQGECGDDLVFTWDPASAVTVHYPYYGQVLSPPSLANEYQFDPVIEYIVYSAYDTTTPPPGYFTIPGTHAVVVQSVDMNNMPPIAIRKIVSPSMVPDPPFDENGNPLFNIAKPSVGAFSNEVGGRAAYNNVQSNNDVYVIQFTPTLDTVIIAQSDGRNPNVVMRAEIGKLKDAMMVTDTAYSATVITSAEHMNKISHVRHDEVLRADCKQGDGGIWLRPNGCRIRSTENLSVGDLASSGIRELLFLDGSNVLDMDYSTKSDEVFLIVYAARNAEDFIRSARKEVALRVKLMPTEGWQHVRWVLNKPGRGEMKYFVEVHGATCDAPDWSVYMLPHLVEDDVADRPAAGNKSGVVLNSLNPNPSNGYVNLEYTVLHDCDVRVYVQDASGEMLTEVDNTFRLAGTYNQQIRLDGYPSGWYTAVVQTSTGVSTKKVVIVR